MFSILGMPLARGGKSTNPEIPGKFLDSETLETEREIRNEKTSWTWTKKQF
jgi:hypothetical protein